MLRNNGSMEDIQHTCVPEWMDKGCHSFNISTGVAPQLAIVLVIVLVSVQMVDCRDDGPASALEAHWR